MISYIIDFIISVFDFSNLFYAFYHFLFAGCVNLGGMGMASSAKLLCWMR